MAKPNLTVIGLDAATFDVLDPLREAGQLPNLADVLASGSSGILRWPRTTCSLGAVEGRVGDLGYLE